MWERQTQVYLSCPLLLVCYLCALGLFVLTLLCLVTPFINEANNRSCMDNYEGYNQSLSQNLKFPNTTIVYNFPHEMQQCE